jgi:cation transport ATPase
LNPTKLGITLTAPSLIFFYKTQTNSILKNSIDIGMSVGTGTDVAMEAADVTLMRGDLNSIPDAIYMSKKTMANIKQNLFWALAYNVIGIPIAALGLQVRLWHLAPYPSY